MSKETKATVETNTCKQTLAPKLRFPEFANDGAWSTVQLEDCSIPVTERVGGKTLTPISISAGIGFVPQAKKFGRDISGNQYSLYTHVRRGDFVFNKGNSLKYPQGCVYQLKDWDEVAAPNVFISFRLKPGFWPEFYGYCFEKNVHGQQIKKFITSGARSNGLLNISKDTFFGISLPCPSIDEQRKIADCLSSLDELITAQAQKVEALKAHKQGLMQLLFPAEGETVPKLRFPQFRNAPAWVKSRLNKFIEEFRENSTVQDQYEVLTSARAGLIKQSEYYENSRLTKRNNIGFNILPHNYITYRSRSDDGLFFFNENQMGITGIVSVYYPVFRIVGGSNKFFISLFSYYAEFIGRKSVGNAQKVLSMNVLKETVLPVPSPEEQKKIADCLSSIDDLVTAQVQKLDALKAHKKGLMQQLFPVPETEE